MTSTRAFATTGENEPSGDEKFFSLARQARCIPIVATQSISSLRSTLSGESWRTLLQGLRTKVLLALSDDFSAQMAAELCGKVERLKPSYTLTEAGQDARVSLMTGRPAAHRTTVSATKTYSVRREYVFEPKIFAELQNGQAIVDVPAHGFAWAGPAVESPKKTAKPRKPIARENALVNELCEVTIHAETGGIRSIRDLNARGNRLSQQIAMRLSNPLPMPAGLWRDPDEGILYSQMIADSIAITSNSSVLGEITSRGRLTRAPTPTASAPVPVVLRKSRRFTLPLPMA